MKRSLWPTRDPVKDYFPQPKEIFSLGLSAAEIAIYAFLLFCEDRQTFQCWPSYRKIGEAVRLSPNTIRKHIRSLEERGLLVTEPTMVTTKDGCKRKDGRWEGRYTAGTDPETGKPIAKSVLARTQRECKEKLQKAMEELEKIDVTKRRDYTVGEWAQLWYENYAKPSVRASTAAYYKNYIDRHIVPRIGNIKLAALTTLQIQKFYNETKAHGRVQRYENMDDLSLSNKTIRGLHTMLRQCLEQAVTERLIPYNPANGCRLPKKEKKKMQIIPPEKIRDYLKAAEEWGVLPMFYLELSTGLRRGELVALLWSDLNLQTKTLTVSKSVSRGKGELVVTEPKTENSVRESYLSDEAIRLLVDERKKHPFSPYMFPSPKTGGMYGPDCVGRIHKKLLEKAGIEEHVRFHDLRHTFSTLAIQSGIDPKTVAEILGHASAEFSLDVYTHVTAGMKKAAAQKISGFMASVG